MNYTWVLPGQRRRVPYENPQGRRVNVLAVLVADGPTPSLTWATAPRTLTSADLVEFLQEAIPRGSGRWVVALDNGAIHTSKVVKGARRALRQQDIVLYYLPPYSPELNAIEPVFGVIKHYDLPQRSYGSVPALMEAVDGAFTRAQQRLVARSEGHPRLTA